jgi:hypothetical protein
MNGPEIHIRREFGYRLRRAGKRIRLGTGPRFGIWDNRIGHRIRIPGYFRYRIFGYRRLFRVGILKIEFRTHKKLLQNTMQIRFL